MTPDLLDAGRLEVVDEDPEVVHRVGHRLGEAGRALREVAVPAERREPRRPCAMERQRVEQHVEPGLVEPRQLQKQPVEPVRRRHEPVDDAQRRARTVLVAPVLRVRGLIATPGLPQRMERRVDRLEGTVERQRLDRALDHRPGQGVGPLPVHGGHRGRARERPVRVVRCCQLGVEPEVLALPLGERAVQNGRDHGGRDEGRGTRPEGDVGTGGQVDDRPVPLRQLVARREPERRGLVALEVRHDRGHRRQGLARVLGWRRRAHPRTVGAVGGSNA